MKLMKLTKGLLLGLAVLIATSAFASNKGSIQLLSDITVAGKQVNAGEYLLKWEGNGPNVELSIMKGSKVVATTPARLVDLNQSSNGNVALLKTNGDGTKSLSQVQFAGKKFALSIGQESASADSGGSK